jgi:uncharacterized SAM-binding protein YcdF (DUF218 family)
MTPEWLGSIKPVLTTLVLPPAGPLLAMLVGWWLVRRARALGGALLVLSWGGLWLLSTQGAAAWMAHHLLPQVAPANVVAVRAFAPQAVVVLGGGAQPLAPEWGGPTLSPSSRERLLMGQHWAAQLHLPLMFSGGRGWGASGTQTLSEAAIAAREAVRTGVPITWQETDSRDTHENARRTAAWLALHGVERALLVTHAWHMPRAQDEFAQTPLRVLPVPVGFIQAQGTALLNWLPSGEGLRQSRWVVREVLARLIFSLN